MKDGSYCKGLPCIPNLVPPSIRRSLYLSPRQSAPSSPPNCCLMVQLLCNTLEHRLRDQGSCDGSLSLLNQKKREEHKKNKVLERRTFICHGWMDYCKKYKFGCLLPRLFSFKPVSCERLKGLELSAGSPSLASIPSSSAASPALISTIAVYLCSVQPTTYSIDWLYFSTFTDRIDLSCMSGFTPVDMSFLQ